MFLPISAIKRDPCFTYWKLFFLPGWLASSMSRFLDTADVRLLPEASSDQIIPTWNNIETYKANLWKIFPFKYYSGLGTSNDIRKLG